MKFVKMWDILPTFHLCHKYLRTKFSGYYIVYVQYQLIYIRYRNFLTFEYRYRHRTESFCDLCQSYLFFLTYMNAHTHSHFLSFFSKEKCGALGDMTEIAEISYQLYSKALLGGLLLLIRTHSCFLNLKGPVRLFRCVVHSLCTEYICSMYNFHCTDN